MSGAIRLRNAFADHDRVQLMLDGTIRLLSVSPSLHPLVADAPGEARRFVAAHSALPMGRPGALRTGPLEDYPWPAPNPSELVVAAKRRRRGASQARAAGWTESFSIAMGVATVGPANEATLQLSAEHMLQQSYVSRPLPIGELFDTSLAPSSD